jgi:hypothetical protein
MLATGPARMLAVPVIVGIFCSKEPAISATCAKRFRQKTCIYTGQPSEAAKNCKRGRLMLRVETKQSVDTLTYKLEGRLTREGAEHVRTLVTRCDGEMRLVIDLTEVMYIDAVGEQVLSLLHRLGARFLAETAYSLDICDRLHLPLTRNGKSDTRALGGSNGKGEQGTVSRRRSEIN